MLGLLSFVASPLLEELLFRGFVLKELLSLLPLAFANALTSLLFVAAHVPYWLSHGGLTEVYGRLDIAHGCCLNLTAIELLEINKPRFGTYFFWRATPLPVK
jgi:membrane protease YdiL (CAAX protease family)